MIKLTGQIPRLALVQIDFTDGSGGEGDVEDFGGQVVGDEFFVGRVESESGWEFNLIFVSGVHGFQQKQRE